MTPKQPFTELVLFVTNQCNLRCDYCYESVHKQGVLSRQVGEQVISWFASQAQHAPRLPTVGFYGGEPMLHFPLIKQLIAYSEEQMQVHGQPIRFGLTTNGTLFTEESLRFFEEKKVDLIVSLDGDEKSHDLFRKTSTGNGSFASIYKMVPSLLEHRSQSFIRMTVNPQTVHKLAANFQFVLDLGFCNVAPVPNIQVDWDEHHWSMFDIQCRKIANIYLEQVMSGCQLNVVFLRDSIKHLLRGKRPQGACGAGKTLLAAAIDGTFYPCHRFASSRDFSGSHPIGDSISGIDEEARRPFARYTSQHCLGCYSPCEQCQGKPICGGGCISKGDEFNNNFLRPLRAEQYMNSIWAQIAQDVVAYLKRHNPSVLHEIFSDEHTMEVDRKERNCV